MTSDVTVRRLAPTDRRTPVLVRRDVCPVGLSCYCCPIAAERWHNNPRSKRTCTEMHPPEDRKCSPPYPAQIPPCPERTPTSIEPPRPLPFQACIDCGRITARRWRDPEDRIVPWCGGTFPTTERI